MLATWVAMWMSKHFTCYLCTVVRSLRSGLLVIPRTKHALRLWSSRLLIRFV